jgi:ABC-2 type transport system ATP-binding protein
VTPVFAIETHGLTKHYGRRPTLRALDELDIAVNGGEIFGFLGPNGAGKSTAIRLLLGLLHPTAGSARVLGLDIVRESVAIRERIGYLPGGIALYDWLTGEQLLDYLAALTGRPAVRRRELCEQLELSSETLRRPVRDYSRGMRQKVGIVQALQHDPELAILDEPSEGLDPLMQLAFYTILERLRSEGRTIFFSSHVLSEVERVCDRVAIIRRGRLVTVERIAELLTNRKRNVELEVRGTPPLLESVPGVSDVRSIDGRIMFRLEGSVEPLLAALHGVTVADLIIEPARLEDVFLELYGQSDPS